VAQLLLASVMRESPTSAGTPASDGASNDGASNDGASNDGASTDGTSNDGEASKQSGDVATRAEPAPEDITQSEETVSDTSDVGANAAASEQPDSEREPGTGSEDTPNP
jgi:hypothetical protein